MTIVNWKAKINVAIKLLSDPVPQGILSKFFTGAGDIIQLATTQTYNPIIESNPEVLDSISNENIGYMFKPRRFRVELGVLPIKAGDYSDGELLTALQVERAEFELAITPTSSDFGSWTWERCRVSTSNPSNLTIDNVPISTWTILTLGVQLPTI